MPETDRGRGGTAICDAWADLAVGLVRAQTTPIGNMVLDNIGTRVVPPEPLVEVTEDEVCVIRWMAVLPASTP